MCWLHQWRLPPACIPRSLGIADPRLSACQVWWAVCLAQTGLGSLWPQTRGEWGERPRLPVSFCRTSDFSSVTQKYLGYCRKWVLFVWLHPGRPSLLGWRRTRASEPCDGAFSFFIASGAQRLEERTQVWPLPLYMLVWILHFSRLCCTSFCESQKLFATRLLVSPDFPILN